MKKRVVSLLTAIAVVVSCFAGCSSSKSEEKSSEQNDVSSETDTDKEQETEEKSIFNETGYPIVNEPLTLTVGVTDPTAIGNGPWEGLEWVKELQETSGVTLEFVTYNEEQLALMHSSLDYPDIFIGSVGSDQQIWEAAQGGYIVPLNDLIEKYSPRWSEYLASDETTLNLIKMDDGNIYSLPYVREEPVSANLRDQWIIRKSWLDELGLEIPTTLDEFYNVLKAFKDNAGTGTIPEDVIPYFFCTATRHTGGCLDLFNAFGTRFSTERYHVTVDDDGKVEFNWTDEAIKEPIKFMEKLVAEGLVPVDNFTMDYDTYINKVNLPTEEKNMGCYHAFANHDTTEEVYVAMASIDTENGKAPLTRVQTNTVVKNMFAIFSNCEYPEVAMRLAELIADPLMGIQAQYGMVDGTYMTETEDGKYMILNYPAGSYRETSAPGNVVPYLLTEEDFENFVYEEGSFTYTRNKAIEEKYSKTQMSRDNLFPNITISAENLDRISELYTDISGYVNTSIAEWIVNGGVDEGWDEYLAQLEDYGLEEYLSLLQEELDAFNGK